MKEKIELKVIGLILIIIFLIVILLWIDYKWGQKKYIQQSMKTYPRRFSDVKIFNSGPKLFDDFFQEIAKAEHHIHILFYIVKDDQFSKDFLNLLERKALEGVEVRLLVDRVGGWKLKKHVIAKLKQSGVLFSYSFKPKFPFFYFLLQRRNHRKITIIDGKISYLGGFNIGKEYVNQDEKLNPWLDYHLKIVGEATHDIQNTFRTDWYTATKTDFSKTCEYFPPLKVGEHQLQILVTDGYGVEDIWLNLINQAQEQIIIGTPYFIPSPKLFSALRNALQNGVIVKIIVPKISDHAFVKEAAYRYFRPLINEGAIVMQFHKGFYHTKVLLVDDKVSDIGTSNFDKRSLFLNSEINCLLFDAHSIETTKKLLQMDLANSAPIREKGLTSPTFFQKCKEMIANVLSPFL